jgi:hypothetical protein
MLELLNQAAEYLRSATVFYWTGRQAGLDFLDNKSLRAYFEAWAEVHFPTPKGK